MSESKSSGTSKKFTVGIALISIIIGGIIGYGLSIGTVDAVKESENSIRDDIEKSTQEERIIELEGQLHNQKITDEQTQVIVEMFEPIYAMLGSLSPQDQAVVIAQLEEIVMNSIIPSPDPGFDDFIVPKDSAKYGPTSNFEKHQDSVFYPLMNENHSVYSVFEDFEESVYLPGLTLTNGDIVENNGVDADDGKINENSKGGKNYSVSVNNSIVFDFDESGIPSIPNYFGVVLTDYQCAQINDWYTTPIIYRVYGDGPSPIIEDSFSFGSKSGNISEDTFLGFFNKDGITSVEIQVDQPTCSRAKILQIDHIQYGLLK